MGADGYERPVGGNEGPVTLTWCTASGGGYHRGLKHSDAPGDFAERWMTGCWNRTNGLQREGQHKRRRLGSQGVRRVTT